VPLTVCGHVKVVRFLSGVCVRVTLAVVEQWRFIVWALHYASNGSLPSSSMRRLVTAAIWALHACSMCAQQMCHDRHMRVDTFVASSFEQCV
jgi:hypothetical protein